MVIATLAIRMEMNHHSGTCLYLFISFVGRPPHRRRLHQIPPEYSRPPESQHLQNEAQHVDVTSTWLVRTTRRETKKEMRFP
uniref:Uncharacterized protein n=1 Tax=Oryza rufipogon TaxID=4529 RepID=A0A0E0PSW9_ORYRU